MGVVGGFFRRIVLPGLMVMVPVYVTAWAVWAMVSWTDGVLRLLPKAWRPESHLGFNLPGLGLILSVLVLGLTGALVANVAGRRIVSSMEGMLQHLPLMRWFYFSSKKVLEGTFGPGGHSFRKVVLVEYPRKGLYTLGLVSGDGPLPMVPGASSTVFLMTAPNPTTGVQVVVPNEQLHVVDWGVDETATFIISAGIIAPKGRQGALEPPPGGAAARGTS